MTPVVLVHGIRTSGSMWDPQLDDLRAAGFDPMAIDLPGHGERREEEFSLAGAISVIHAALREAGGRAHLVGSSLGGMLAIHAAGTAPELVSSLVACACSTQPLPLTAGAYARGLSASSHFPEGVSRRLVGTVGAKALWRKGRAEPATVSKALTAIAQVNLRADLAKTTGPVTILNPKFDQFRWQERQFAAAAPQGKLVVLPFGMHLVNVTHPKRYNHALISALQHR